MTHLGGHVVALFLESHDSIMGLVYVAAEVHRSADIRGKKVVDISQLVDSDRVRASADILAPRALNVAHSGAVLVHITVTAPALKKKQGVAKRKVLQKRRCYKQEGVAKARYCKGEVLQRGGNAKGGWARGVKVRNRSDVQQERDNVYI